MTLPGILSSSLFNGLLINYAPGVLKGAMREYLGKIPFKDMVQWVNENRSLWDALPPNYQKVFADFGPKLGKLEWLTYDWVIESGCASAPSLASLFMGWPKGQVWLQNQINDIKIHIVGG